MYWNVVHKGEKTHENTDESHKPNVEQKKPDTEEYILSDYVYLKRKRSEMNCQESGYHPWTLSLKGGTRKASVSWPGGYLYGFLHFVNIYEGIYLWQVHFPVCIMYLNKPFWK